MRAEAAAVVCPESEAAAALWKACQRLRRWRVCVDHSVCPFTPHAAENLAALHGQGRAVAQELSRVRGFTGSEIKSPEPPHELRVGRGGGAEAEVSVLYRILRSLGIAAPDTGERGSSANLHCHVNVANPLAAGRALGHREVLSVWQVSLRPPRPQLLWPLADPPWDLSPRSLPGPPGSGPRAANRATTMAPSGAPTRPLLAPSPELSTPCIPSSPSSPCPLGACKRLPLVAPRSTEVPVAVAVVRGGTSRRQLSSLAKLLASPRLLARQAWVVYDLVTLRLCRSWLWRDRWAAPLYATGAEFAFREKAWEQGAVLCETRVVANDVPSFVERCHALVRTAEFEAQEDEAARLRMVFAHGSTPGKHVSLNVEHVSTLGTLEFRRMHATTAEAEALRWVHFCAAFVEAFSRGGACGRWPHFLDAATAREALDELERLQASSTAAMLEEDMGLPPGYIGRMAEERSCR